LLPKNPKTPTNSHSGLFKKKLRLIYNNKLN